MDRDGSPSGYDHPTDDYEPDCWGYPDEEDEYPREG